MGEFPPLTEEQKRMEADANFFAMCLLIPRDFIVPDFHAMFPDGADVESEAGIEKLAKRYGVSTQLMLLRLSHLQLLL